MDQSDVSIYFFLINLSTQNFYKKKKSKDNYFHTQISQRNQVFACD